jgi:hypothetical protein
VLNFGEPLPFLTVENPYRQRASVFDTEKLLTLWLYVGYNCTFTFQPFLEGNSKAMKRMKLAAIVLTTFFAVGTISAQILTPSRTVLEKWKSREKEKQKGDTTFSFSAVGVSVEKFQAKGITITFSAAISRDVRFINALSFRAQLMKVSPSRDGAILQAVGSGSKIESRGFERTEGDDEEDLGDRQITMPNKPEANAVQLTVVGLDQEPDKAYTIIVPITDQIQTASLGRAKNP